MPKTLIEALDLGGILWCIIESPKRKGNFEGRIRREDSYGNAENKEIGNFYDD